MAELIPDLREKGFEDEDLVKEIQIRTGCSREAALEAIAFDEGDPTADDVG